MITGVGRTWQRLLGCMNAAWAREKERNRETKREGDEIVSAEKCSFFSYRQISLYGFQGCCFLCVFLFCYMKAYISWEFLGIFFMPSFFIYYSPVILFYTSMYKLYYHTHRYIQYMQHNYYIFKTAIQTKSVIWYIKFSLFNVWKCIILSIIKIFTWHICKTMIF